MHKLIYERNHHWLDDFLVLDEDWEHQPWGGQSRAQLLKASPRQKFTWDSDQGSQTRRKRRK